MKHSGHDPLDEQLAGLSREMTPSKDVWPDIARDIRIDASRDSARASRRGNLRFTAAAALAAACIASALTWAVVHGRSTPLSGAGSAANLHPVSFEDPGNKSYLAARADIEKTFHERLSLLDPDTRNKIESSLGVIRQAHADIRKALIAEPDSPLLEQLLETTLHDEFDLYDQVVRSTQPRLVEDLNMSHPRLLLRHGAALGTLSLLSLVAPWSLVQAGRAIEERHPADSDGTVEISDVAGDIEVIGWDRPEIEVSGTADERVEKIEITGSGGRNTVRIIQRSSGPSWHMGVDDTRLQIHLPAKSTVSATLVSANLKIHDVSGEATLHTVSGNVSGAVGGDLHVHTVSGNVNVSAHSARTIEVKTISGDIHLDGGAGDIEISTVSGEAIIALATVTHGRFKSVSGDLSTSLSLSPDAQLDGQSVSGTLNFDFPALPAADFDLQTLSGDIDTCFGPKAVDSRYGPGSRLVFKNGESHAHVRIETKNGDIKLCDKSPAGHAAVPAVDSNLRHVDFRYVL